MSPVSQPPAEPGDADLEAALAAVELRLADLGDALRERDSARIERHASELHCALAQAVDRFVRAAREGVMIAPLLRHRLAHTSGQVAAQRESLARATAALDRAIDVLMPREHAALYSTFGAAERSARGASVLA